MSSYKPPFSITPEILRLSEQISRELGRLEGQKLTQPSLILRRSNQIKTIQASLAIEGNTLDLDQVTDLLAGKRILGPSKDILEVKNASHVYEQLSKFNPLSSQHLSKAHKTLMDGLIENAGEFREKGAGIYQGTQVTHMAPPAKRVPKLVSDLFEFLSITTSLSWLLKSCVFHYEFEFIHPFMDGNGRMGRLWQQLLLIKEHPVFEFVSIEEIIKKNQIEYYDSLAKSDKTADSEPFIVFSLETILAALKAYESETTLRPNDPLSRLEFSRSTLTGSWFRRIDYLKTHKDISTATASRDLVSGVQEGLLLKRGDKNQIEYYFK